MKVLVTGGSGTLGKAIQKYVSNKNDHSFLFPTSEELDVTVWGDIRKYLDHTRPDIVLHAAAFIGLVPCEQNKEQAYWTNIVGTQGLVRIADHFGIHVIYISTDYVFDGEKGDYDENGIPNPLSYYAKTKWAGECIARAAAMGIIRTSFCKNDWKPEKAFVDKLTSADTVDNIVPLIYKAIELQDHFGTLHIGTEKKSFFDLAKKINSDVQPMSYKDVNVAIPRDTSFNLKKMKQLLGV